MKQQGEQKINPQNKDEYRKDKMNGSQEEEIKIKIKKQKCSAVLPVCFHLLHLCLVHCDPAEKMPSHH